MSPLYVELRMKRMQQEVVTGCSFLGVGVPLKIISGNGWRAGYGEPGITLGMQ